MINLVKSSRPAAARDTLVILDDVARLRQLDLARNDRQYLLEQRPLDICGHGDHRCQCRWCVEPHR
jgi:hypothetical protein